MPFKPIGNDLRNMKTKLLATPILLASIIILGVFLRFYKIDARNFYCDEILTINIISQSSVQEIWQKIINEFPVDLPLFYVVLHSWSYFSKSAFWLRAFSALAGLFLILFAYKLAKYLFNKNTALLTLYLLSISPFLVLYAQTVRYYSLIALVNLSALYFFIKAIHNNRKHHWFFYVVIRTVSIYINYSSFLFFAFEGLFVAIYRKNIILVLKSGYFAL